MHAFFITGTIIIIVLIVYVALWDKKERILWGEGPFLSAIDLLPKKYQKIILLILLSIILLILIIWYIAVLRGV